MSSEACHYDCQAPLQNLAPNPDITGFGVRLSYNITAGLAVSIVCFYYVFAYRFDTGVFWDQSEDQTSEYRPNPIDLRILGGLREVKFYNLKLIAPGFLARAHRALIPCMLVMSDLQLLVGWSILLSGVAQLRCGISMYHWTQLINLAWFASVTHFACLTFLRTHLHQHKAQRLWRIIAMSLLVALLITAITTTGNQLSGDFPTIDFRPANSDYAICYLRHFTISEQDVSSQERSSFAIEWAMVDVTISRQNMIISNVMLGLGLIVRLFRSFEKPSNTVSRLRTKGGKILEQILLRMLSLCRSLGPLEGLTIAILLRPLTAMIVLILTLWDLWSSMLFEVWWLMVSLIWGTLKLWAKDKEPSPEPSWGFGQILPLFLLAVPIIPLVENLFSCISPPFRVLKIRPEALTCKAETIAVSTLHRDTRERQLVSPALHGDDIQTCAEKRSPIDLDPLEPGRDIYSAPWSKLYIGVLLFSLCNISAWTLLVIFGHVRLQNLYMPIGVTNASLYFVILFSLLFEHFWVRPMLPSTRQGLRWSLFVINIVNVLFFVAFIWVQSGLWIYLDNSSVKYSLYGFSALYLLLCFVDALFTRLRT